MAEAMEYSSGVKGMRFDVVRLDRNHLGELYDNDKVHYGALKDRMKQACNHSRGPRQGRRHP